MLPLQQAYEVRAAVLEYIKATFHFKDREVGQAFYRFVEDEQHGLFKGPYISLKTPFVKAREDEKIPLDIKPPFQPHQHQIEAFHRLTTHDGHNPQPTLLTTGTGSGKTECFLYPILDYVYQTNKYGVRPGVKVIIMYPMNALASDQAKRLAEAIWGTKETHPLRGKVTAGLFISEGDEKNLPTQMGEHNIIEKRTAIIDTVPDILLTNFKMLDYGLMQQQYMPLWKGNIDAMEPMLRFIVLDELHTYDGAQGTDVANLIRRLKLKLHLPKGQLTPIGTSATIGNKDDSKQLLCEYATDVFGEEFTEDSVIEEHRVMVDDFFDRETSPYVPVEQKLKRLNLANASDTMEYVANARKAWLPDCSDDAIEIGRRLRGLRMAKDLLMVTSQGVILLSDLKTELGKQNADYQRLLRMYPEQANVIVESLLALISEAKIPDDSGNPRFPLLYLQVQLWQRELSGIERFVQQEPEFTWRDSVPRNERLSLPIYFCRDCGASGWITTFKETERRFGTDSARINQAFMKGEKEVRLMNTESKSHEPIDEYKNGELAQDETLYVHTNDLTIGAKTDDNILRVRVVTRGRYNQGNKVVLDKKCPLCMSDSLAIVGGRTSTLSSVAVSQVMSSDFDTADASKRKMLTFSNSVQDAAHLAGFYEVRTFRFLFRQSIQHYLKSVGKAITLKQLQEGFKTYWKQHLDGDEYYYRFMPDELMERIDLQTNYRNTATRELTERFKREFDLRVDWEICSEFGMMSRIGRTLEKTGSGATYFREEDLRQVFRKIEPWLRENNMAYVAEREDLFLKFANGILHRLRSRGGVDHEFLRLYRTQQLRPFSLNWYRMDNVHFLHKRFGGSRVPRMIGFQSVKKKDEVLDVTTVRGNRKNWFYDYFIKSIQNPSGEILQPNVDAINDFYRQLLETMADCFILDRKEANGIANYAIRPEAIYVEASVQTIKCEKCESHMYVAGSDTLSEDMACLDFKCNDGVYNIMENSGENYYRKVYNREISPRIYAHEHTGLLEREARETLERDFREHPNPHSINVLTATSTLEMGIDIGDLNVVANTGIPPKPSNFLQRVGRAGRKEGAALVLNYAKAGKHDMYYFAEPLDMMQGEVGTPGCFLEAKDILHRHFYAFCIDSWTSGDRNNIIPNRIDQLHLDFNLLEDEQFFINRINSYIKEHRTTLAEKYRQQYPDKTQHVLDELFETLTNGGFYKRITDEFEQLVERLVQLKKEQQELKDRLVEIPQNDVERRKEILDQNRGLRSQMRAIRDQNTVEFMTNAGLLPNYAFPETGVKLTATIFSRKALGDDEDNVQEPETLELIRPASQGIRELVPSNHFYTQKLNIEIKGLSLNDRQDSIKLMRYCSDCDALAEEGSTEYNMNCCPKCGSDSWHSNRHRYLRFTTATTSVYRNDAVLDDRNDEREQHFYHTMKHFRFNHVGSVTSYGLKNVAFGIEFCKDVQLTEANYGDRDQMAEPVEINGEQRISSLGFVTCKYCGRTTAVVYGGKDSNEMHYPFCNHKEVGYPADEQHKDTFERLFLYRTMQTEAIKVLLPIQIFDTDASTQLFKAGLELGLRYYYKSNPEHLHIDGYKEYNKATQNYDNYLVIYDTIPGGTGYLSKLYDKEEFTKLLRLSYEHIRDCTCRLEGKDGCYHCILSYGNQWNRGNLSRERAEELFKRIVDECGNWETIEGSIGTITTSGVIEDSELEILFTKAMEGISKKNGWTWKKNVDAINETYFYTLAIIDDGLELRYNVYPQYRLGPAQGVATVTKPDFQFICCYARIDDEELNLDSLTQWSVYLDGYQYHASEENMGFYHDVERREAIRKSQSAVARRTWTLTWDDLRPFIEEELQPTDLDSLNIFVSMLENPELTEQQDVAQSFAEQQWTENERTNWRLPDGLAKIEKEQWQAFWHKYNILQIYMQDETVGADTVGISLDNILDSFPGLETIVTELVANKIPFDTDGGFDLEEDGVIVASAAIKIEGKNIVIDDFDDQAVSVFEAHGYKALTPETFDINELKI